MNGLDLKFERLRQGLKQWEVSSRLGVSQTVLCDVEQGRKVDEEFASRALEAIRELAKEKGKRRT